MNANNKKLFLIFPKESESEQNLFKAFSSNISEQTKDDTLIKFILKNSAAACEYQERFDDDNVDNEKLKQEIIELIKIEKDLVIECHIKLNNTSFFSKIKDSYPSDAKEICTDLDEILSGLVPVLKELKIVEKLSDFSKIIMAAHIGGESKTTYLDIQRKINESLSKEANLKFVYFSGLDEPAYNNYIHDHVKFSAYSYEKLIKEKSDEQFRYFLELLGARAEDEGIEFFKDVTLKTLINELIENFLQVNIDCSGILELEKRHLDTSQYITKSFGASLTEYLSAFSINSTLSELKKYSPIIHEKLEGKVHGLMKCTSCKEFESKFKEFAEEASKIKKSF